MDSGTFSRKAFSRAGLYFFSRSLSRSNPKNTYHIFIAPHFRQRGRHSIWVGQVGSPGIDGNFDVITLIYYLSRFLWERGGSAVFVNQFGLSSQTLKGSRRALLLIRGNFAKQLNFDAVTASTSRNGCHFRATLPGGTEPVSTIKRRKKGQSCTFRALKHHTRM